MTTADSNSFDVRVNNPTPLALAAAGMAPGSWATFTCNYAAGKTLFDLLDVTLTKRCTEYADKMVWDSSRRQIYFTGGGHNASDSVDLKTIVYNDDQNTWTDLGRPPWYSPPTQTRHAYQHNTLEGSTHYFMVYGGSPFVIRTRNVVTNVWSTTPGPNPGGTAIGSLEWFPTYGANGTMVVVNGRGPGDDPGVVMIRPYGGSWSQLATPTMGAYHNVGLYSPPKNLMYFGGGVSSRRLYTLSNTGQITARVNCPVVFQVSDSVSTVDPVTGNLLVIHSDKVVREFNPDTNSWGTVSSPPNAFWQGAYQAGAAFCIVAAPINDYGVTMFIAIGSTGNSPAIYLRKGS